jgi:hypothetical protein
MKEVPMITPTPDQFDELSDYYTRQAAYRSLHNDLNTVMSELLAEAKARNWCADFTSFLLTLPASAQACVQTIIWRTTIKYEVTLTIDVPALTEDAANDIVYDVYQQIDESLMFDTLDNVNLPDHVTLADATFHYDGAGVVGKAPTT